MKGKKNNLVVKTNQLNTALQTLSKVEIRMIQLAIVDARETNTGLDTNTPLKLDALRYAEMFGGTRQNAYDAMKRAEETLFNRRFTYLDDNGKPIKSRWLQQVRYLDGEGVIELVFTLAVVNGISRIDGLEQFFTSYLLEQTTRLNSVYSVRLYELLVQWKKAKKTPCFELETFRGQMGVGIDEYAKMSDFKRRVLDLAVKEINDSTDIKVKYEQRKKGKRIVGFNFTVIEKPKRKNQREQLNSVRDRDTPDFFHELTDKQIDVFGSKLAADSYFGSKYAKPGESPIAFENRVKRELVSIENQKLWMDDLIRVGFKQ